MRYRSENCLGYAVFSGGDGFCLPPRITSLESNYLNNYIAKKRSLSCNQLRMRDDVKIL